MNINIYYNIMLLVFLPLLVIQTRFLLTKQSTDDDRKGISQTLIEIVPHDLLIIGMTLSFASLAFYSSNESLAYLINEKQLQYIQWGIFLFALTIPLSAMLFISVTSSKTRKMSIGLLIYLLSALLFLFSQIRF